MVELTSDSLYLPYLNFEEQSSHPSAPGAGRFLLYIKDGVWYSVDSGGSPVALGGMENPMTTAGDLILGGASGAPGRLGKGSDSDVLTVDPATHLPVWAAPAAGSAGDVVLLDSTTVGSGGAADVTFSGISQSYNDLILTMHARGERNSPNDDLRVQLNGVTSSICDWLYDYWYIGGSNSANGTGVAYMQLGQIPAAQAPSNSFGSVEYIIHGYSKTASDKIVKAEVAFRQTSGGGGYIIRGHAAGYWAGADNVDSIKVWCANGDIAEGSILKLYGRT